MSEYTGHDYFSNFLVNPKKRKAALDRALDISKFEIELYWKRAAYFWTLIAAVFVGFVAVQSLETSIRQELSTMIAGIGFIFSVAWYCVIRGSKSWQENWESHVDLLEDEVIGPLYKTVLQRKMADSSKEAFSSFFLESYPYSVSKVNQLVSVYVILVWFFLMLTSVDISSARSFLQSGLILIINLAMAYFVLRFGASTHNEEQDDNLVSALKRNRQAISKNVCCTSRCSSEDGQKNSNSTQKKTNHITAITRHTELPRKKNDCT